MVEILPEIVSGFLGAVVALFLREIFVWKGQGRNESLKRNEKLITECFGKLKFVFERIITKESRLQMTDDDYSSLLELSNRYFFRIPKDIYEKMDKILLGSEIMPDMKGFSYDCEEDASDYITELIMQVDFHIVDLVAKIRKLESYYEGITKRIWFTFLVWNF